MQSFTARTPLQPAHSDSREDAGVLLNSVIYTDSVPTATVNQKSHSLYLVQNRGRNKKPNVSGILFIS